MPLCPLHAHGIYSRRTGCRSKQTAGDPCPKEIQRGGTFACCSGRGCYLTSVKRSPVPAWYCPFSISRSLTIFITKVSWFTLIAACYFGYKNFSVKLTIIGIVIGVLLANIGFYFSKKFINKSFNEKQITIFKSFFEYTLIFWVIYYVLF